MPRSLYRRTTPQTFEPDSRPGADTHVYCKGCGQILGGQARRPPGRAKVTTMMCDECQTRYEHDLIPSSGAPSYCFRCGGLDEVFVATEFAPTTYRICPRCVPERAARFRSGDFEPVVPSVE